MKAYVWIFGLLLLASFVSAGGIWTQNLNASNISTTNISISGNTTTNTLWTKEITFDKANKGLMDWNSDIETFTLQTLGDDPWVYAPYAPDLSLGKKGSNANMFTPVGLMIYVQPASTSDSTEMYGFWGGVHDEGTAKGCSYDSIGLFAYNALWGTSSRTYGGLWGVSGTNELDYAENLVITTLGGGKFQASTGMGSGTYASDAYGVHILTAGGIIGNNYGLKIDDVATGDVQFSIQTNSGNATFNNGGDADTNFQVKGDTEDNMLLVDSSTPLGAAGNSDLLYLGGTTNAVKVFKGGNMSFTGTAGFYPRRLYQTTIPAGGTGTTQIDVGEMVIWSDSDDSGKPYFVYNDPVSGVKSKELG